MSKKYKYLSSFLIVIFVSVLFYICLLLFSNKPYMLTYESIGDTPKSIAIDENFVLSDISKESDNTATDRITSLSTKNIISASRMGNQLYDICINNDCKDISTLLHDESYSQSIYTTLTEDINIRMYPTEKDFNTELVRISDMKIVDIEGAIAIPGVNSSKSYFFQRSIEDRLDIIEIDKLNFEVTNVYYNVADAYQIIVNDELYFYIPGNEFLQTYNDSSNQLEDTLIKNIAYVDGSVTNFKEIYINNEQFYMIDTNSSSVLITNFKEIKEIKNSEYDIFHNPVFFKSINDENVILILGYKNSEPGIYYNFYEIDENLDVNLLNSGITKHNIGPGPEISTNYYQK